MKIKIFVSLFPPSGRIIYGGKSYVIFSKEFDISVTPDVISNILKGVLKHKTLGEFNIKSYNKNENIMRVEGRMSSIEESYIGFLKRNDWDLHEDGARHHNIEA